MKYRVWFERAVLPELAEEVAERCTLLGPGDASRDDMYEELGQAEGIVAGSNHYTATVMDLAPDLKVIARTGIGFDRVDLTAATARGIAVCNAPDGPTISTAEHTIALLLAVAKHLNQSQRRLAAGEKNLYTRHEAIELDDKTLGLVGFGRIGRRVARVAGAFGMHVHAYDPYLRDTGLSNTGEVTMVDSLEQLLEAAHVVSVHVPLTDATHRLFGPDQLASMRPQSIFINTARGELVDQEALLAALDSGHLFGAGLDVTSPEPIPRDHPLLGRDDVVVTPHIASGTADGKRRLLSTALDVALEVLNGQKPASLVNPAVWK